MNPHVNPYVAITSHQLSKQAWLRGGALPFPEMKGEPTSKVTMSAPHNTIPKGGGYTLPRPQSLADRTVEKPWLETPQI